MKYYTLLDNYYEIVTTDFTGHYQHPCIGFKNWDYLPHGYKLEGPISELSKLPEGQILSECEPTTFLISNYTSPIKRYIIVKKDFIDLLQNFRVGENQHWKIKVHYKEAILDYYLLYLSYPSQEKYIDFENSLFWVSNPAKYVLEKGPNYQKQYVDISDFEEYSKNYWKLKKDNCFLKSEKLIFDFRKPKEDLFRINGMDNITGYYVSERLKNAMEKKEYTGIKFHDIDNQYNSFYKFLY